MDRQDVHPIVCIEHLSKHFGAGTARVDALRGIDMAVQAGDVVGLMGPSGSGKTTLLNCIACITEPSTGRMMLDGEVVYDEGWLRADLRRLRLDKIGFIFQYPNLLPFLDATDNVAIVLHLAGYGAGAARKQAVELLEYLEVAHRKHAVPAQIVRGRGATGSDRAGDRQWSTHHLGGRADGAARFGSGANRHGPASSHSRRAKRGGHRRHARRDDS